MTKPTKIGLGIAVAALVAGLGASASGGAVRLVLAWIALACLVASAAYAWNRPEWLGKVRGRVGPQALVVLPYLCAFRIACGLMRRWRPADGPTCVAPGIWVGGRVDARSLPSGVALVVDLVAEYPADRTVRGLSGYRGFPVLDGGCPPAMDAFLALVGDLARWREGDVLVHCDSGRGRAPTVAAALLVARGLAPDVRAALETIRAARPVAAPTRSDVVFLVRAEPALQRIAVGSSAFDLVASVD